MPRAEIAFLIFWAVGTAIAWPLWIRASIRSRRILGEPLVPKAPMDATFCERGASGQALDRIGGARNCLMVAVTGDEIWITPTFPFNMIAPYGMLGMEHRIAKRDVISVQAHKALWRTSIILQFTGKGAGRKALDLRLKAPGRFLAAIER